MLITVNEHTDRNCCEHCKHKRHRLDNAHYIGTVAEIVNEIIADICKVNVKADEKYGNRNVDKHKLLEFNKPLEVKHAEKLLPEASLLIRGYVVIFIERKHRNKTEYDYEHTHNNKQTHIIIVFTDEHTADYRS